MLKGVCFLFLSASILAETKVEVEPFCFLDEQKAYVFTAVPVRYKFKMDFGDRRAGDVEESRYLFELNCERETGICRGVLLNLQKLDTGKPLGMFDITTMGGVKIVSDHKKIVVIRWGVYRTFVVDFESERLEYFESGDIQEGRGIGTCSARPKNSTDIDSR